MRLSHGSCFKVTKKQKAGCGGKTRLHLVYSKGKPFPDGLTVAGVPKFKIINRFGAINRPDGALLVNTGKNYHAPYPINRDPLPMATVTRNIRGHGYNTSRVRRNLREVVKELAEIYP